MSRLTTFVKAIVLAGMAGIGFQARANLVNFDLSGFMSAQNAAALTLHSQAAMSGSTASIPFSARLVLDTGADPASVTNIPTLQIHQYTAAVHSIQAVIGGYAFSTNRPLFDDPGLASLSPWDEELTEVSNGVVAGSFDRLVVETADKSGIAITPGPRTPLFDAFNKAINLNLGATTFTTLDFRLMDTRLDVRGTDMFGAATIPTGINLPGLNSFLSSFRLDVSATYSGPLATTASSKATFFTQNFSLAVSPVPEANGFIMLLVGLAVLVIRTRATWLHPKPQNL